MSFSIILPTLNEKDHIIELIESISKNFKGKNSKYEIIIVDDNSIDGTIETVKKYSQKNKRIRLYVRKKKKKNLAKSINLGILKSKYENIIWMDADFQHPPQYIKKMITNINNFDVIIFSRFLKHSKRYYDDNIKYKEFNENQSVFFNKVCKFFFFDDITDYTSGYICIKKKILKNYILKGFYGDYFLHLIVYCKRNRIKIIELPFKENLRKTGFSKTIGSNKIEYATTCANYFFSVLKNILIKNLY